MTIPGGAGTPPGRQLQTSPVLGPPASVMGSEFPLPGLRPSLCPGPMRQGVSYVHYANLYIRNTLPDDMSIPSSASPGPIGVGQSAIHRSAWKRNSANFACRIVHRSPAQGHEDGF